MSHRGLQMLLAAAITDPTRQEALLRGNLEAYEGFDLAEEEIGELQAITALTLQEFAHQAHRLFYNEDLPLPVGDAITPQT